MSEASGIAPGPTVGSFWVVDDATGTTQVALVRSNGSLIARVPVPGMRSLNAEALAVAPCGTEKCLYVGDIGGTSRDVATIFRARIQVERPWLRGGERFDFRYPAAPVDAEGFVVSGDRIVIVSKPARRSGLRAEHQVFTGALTGGELRAAGTFTLPRPPRPLQSLVTGNVVTDMAFDGSRMLVLTYDQLLSYRRPSPTADPAQFHSWPVERLPSPMLAQAEGVTGLPDGRGYAIVSEAGMGQPARLVIQR